MDLRWLKPLVATSTGALLCVALIAPIAGAQEKQSDSTRKIVARTSPVCPELARRMNLEGTVKLLVIVARDGSVKSAEVRGGHPLLVKAAESAIHSWKWAPAEAESQELVEMTFQRK